jgi:hypothetical protein
MGYIALLQKCHYKWQTSKCINYNVDNLIIFIFENVFLFLKMEKSLKIT